MWTPDVYEGAPTPVTTFFASAPKVAAMALLVRVLIDAMGPTGPALAAWQQIIIFLSLASIILGAVGAIGQKNIKRLRSEEHTSELQSLMRLSYAVFCLKKKKNKKPPHNTTHQEN